MMRILKLGISVLALCGVMLSPALNSAWADSHANNAHSHSAHDRYMQEKYWNAVHITSNDVHGFFMHLNTALNDYNFVTRQKALNKMIEPYATFYNRWNHYYVNPHHYYNNTFPHFYTKVYASKEDAYSTKSGVIAGNEKKRQTIPGYRVHYEVKNIYVSPDKHSADIELIRSEYSMIKQPHVPYYKTLEQYSGASCRAFVGKREHKLHIVRMDCTTNLPIWSHY